MMIKTTSLITLLILLSMSSICRSEVLFGPEFTFTNQKLIASYERKRPTSSMELSLTLLRRWESNLHDLCKVDNCTITPTIDKHGQAYRVTFKDGWWLQISQDMMVLEVQTKPSTISEFQQRSETLNRFVFDMTVELGLEPHERIGGGHINIDMKSAFGNDSLLFRNFIVDHANHPELSWGIFGGHLGNAPPLASLGHKQVQTFLDVIYEFDHLSDDEYFKEIPYLISRHLRLAEEIEDRVYTSNPLGWSNTDYNQALNYRNTGNSNDSARLEIRSYRPQRSFIDFILQITFLEERLKYLQGLPEPLPANIPKNWDPPPDRKVELFLSLISETGLDQSVYREIIPKKMESFNGENEKLTCKSVLNL